MSELYIQKRLPRTNDESFDLKRFHEMESQRSQYGGRIKPSSVKYYARVKTRLIKSGIIEPGSRANVRTLAMQAFKAMPWYRQWYLKAKFWLLRLTRKR